jgi:hypothetical protein
MIQAAAEMRGRPNEWAVVELLPESSTLKQLDSLARKWRAYLQKSEGFTFKVRKNKLYGCFATPDGSAT